MLKSHIEFKCKLVMSEHDRRFSLGLSSGNGSVSVSVFLSSVDMSEMSHSSGSGGVSTDGFDGPAISSLSGSTSEGGTLLLLEMEVRFSTDSANSVRVTMLLTSCWGSPCLTRTMSKKLCYLPFV